jgi:hypothetical protein
LLLVDECGQILAREGELPLPPGEDAWWSPCLAALSASAQLSAFLGRNFPEDVLYFSGTELDLYAAHVGRSIALLAAVPPGARPGLNGSGIRMVRQAADELLGLAIQLDRSSQAPAAAAAPVDKPEEAEIASDASDLDEVFEQAAMIQLDEADVNTFWDDLINGDGSERVFRTGTLSYEQARKLGLAPD